ncbi:TIGR02281 family clan AA aspartic protease [Sphingomonas oleivorans]|uniref:TIGR02281 family clan AA aspartic protease n=1 Tax=Sphingomonas oleivorans TaxID=1735121 RepID=A0A2T5FWW1_9SPHN|nr:TIGR02281 family clan AA aspartic protease [Sphingomonas oleivorans]PTQ10235.1 TIGR02281 family clan AA aspartic protease [Sphingomonas oleivorans]
MTGGDGLSVVMIMLMLVLVVSALAARRLPPATFVKMALGWLAIFMAGFLIYAYRHEFAGLGDRLRGALYPETPVAQGGELRIPMASDGHFWVRANVNGTELRFLIDSGATMTALSVDGARSAGIDIDHGGFPVAVNTANGLIYARRLRIDRLELANVVRQDLGAISAPEFGDTNVLGMNFLSSLQGWGVEQGTLILRP